ncbi:RWP-RK domain [Plasmopara halstedii]|uniref:RWP-RK domain n=1 Tax=Plasmopara halstedii TaxID=4781 RepID=A0A0N7L8L7_PLAHL|nr:RWP-RK domain [Plasmopara halstedii]CEG50227.1 RWP-RK domain [Plasmopara halstedii]|eukprot:XP_024586596.1 RWP-RK domain [Plasmopara halstedii]
MAVEMEQQRTPELTVSESESRVGTDSSASLSLLSSMDENKPFAPIDISKSVLMWPESNVQRIKPTTPGGSSLKVETSLAVVRNMGVTLDESVFSKPSDGLPVPSISCDSVSPVSPTVMKDLNFDSRLISDAWSYEGPQNMYALLTQPTHQIDPLINGTGLSAPYMQMHQQPLQLQLDQLPLQMSPLHGSSFSSLYMSGGSLTLSPHQMMMHQPLNVSSGNYATTPSNGNLNDSLISGDPTLFLAPSGSPIKQQILPMPHGNGVVDVKSLTLNELRPHFNKPMAVVAKELGVCITLMKKICRRNGLIRWPHRRIRSLVNRITSLQVLASNAAGAECKRFHGQIATLREELSSVIQNPNEKSRKSQSDSKMSMDTGQFNAGDVLDIFPNPNEMVETKIDVQNESIENHTNVKSQNENAIDADSNAIVGVKSVEKEAIRETFRSKKRKQTFGLHAHQPPPIKICWQDDLPSICRLQSQSVPGRRLRGDRRYGRSRDVSIGGCSTSVRPSTTTHRNGRRGSISSILNGMPE